MKTKRNASLNLVDAVFDDAAITADFSLWRRMIPKGSGDDAFVRFPSAHASLAAGNLLVVRPRGGFSWALAVSSANLCGEGFVKVGCSDVPRVVLLELLLRSGLARLSSDESSGDARLVDGHWRMVGTSAHGERIGISFVCHEIAETDGAFAVMPVGKAFTFGPSSDPRRRSRPAVLSPIGEAGDGWVEAPRGTPWTPGCLTAAPLHYDGKSGSLPWAFDDERALLNLLASKKKAAEKRGAAADDPDEDVRAQFRREACRTRAFEEILGLRGVVQRKLGRYVVLSKNSGIETRKTSKNEFDNCGFAVCAKTLSTAPMTVRVVDVRPSGSLPTVAEVETAVIAKLDDALKGKKAFDFLPSTSASGETELSELHAADERGTAWLLLVSDRGDHDPSGSEDLKPTSVPFSAMRPIQAISARSIAKLMRGGGGAAAIVKAAFANLIVKAEVVGRSMLIPRRWLDASSNPNATVGLAFAAKMEGASGGVACGAVSFSATGELSFFGPEPHPDALALRMLESGLRLVWDERPGEEFRLAERNSTWVEETPVRTVPSIHRSGGNWYSDLVGVRVAPALGSWASGPITNASAAAIEKGFVWRRLREGALGDFESMAAMCEDPFIRIGSCSVMPAPFKHLREWLHPLA
jgi:hypothetical protein